MSRKPEKAIGAKPCPFCGTGDLVLNRNKTAIIEFPGCGAFMINYVDGVERDVIAAWNRRYSQPVFNQEEN